MEGDDENKDLDDREIDDYLDNLEKSDDESWLNINYCILNASCFQVTNSVW